MKNLFKVLFLILATLLVSCQSEDDFEDKTSNVTIQNPKEGVFRLYPTGVTTRSSNVIYIDLMPNNRQLYYNIQSSSYTPQQIEANYKVEFFVAEYFDWLHNAYNVIDNFPRTNSSGQLYHLFPQDNMGKRQYYPATHLGYRAEYSIMKVTSVQWRLSMDKVDEIPEGTMTSYMFPVRIKLTHRLGGPSFTYDLIHRCEYYGSSPFAWTFFTPNELN